MFGMYFPGVSTYCAFVLVSKMKWQLSPSSWHIVNKVKSVDHNESIGSNIPALKFHLTKFYCFIVYSIDIKIFEYLKIILLLHRSFQHIHDLKFYLVYLSILFIPHLNFYCNVCELFQSQYRLNIQVV